MVSAKWILALGLGLGGRNTVLGGGQEENGNIRLLSQQGPRILAVAADEAFRNKD